MNMIKNPILPGFNPDPCLCRRGDDYYLVVSSFEWLPALPIYHSRNLSDWSLLTHGISDENIADLRRLPSAKGIWAPCLTWCEEEGRFYLLFSIMNSMNARFFDVDNFLMTATSIEGPWTKPVYLHSAGFDPSLFHDEDGRKWVVSLEWETRDDYHKPGTICIAEYDAVNRSIVGVPRRIWDGGTRRGCIEGPHLYKRNGWYYLLCAEGGTGYGHCVTMARSRNIEGPYEGDPCNPILTSTPDFDEWDNDDAFKLNRYNHESILQKSGHGSIVETKYGEVYMAHHCGRPFLPELRCTLGRETCLQKMMWTTDDWLRLHGGGSMAQIDVDASRLVQDCAETTSLYSDWSYIKHGLHALYTPRISPSGFVVEHEREGWLRLRGQESVSSLNRSSILAHKLTAIHAKLTTVLEMKPYYYQAYAGIMIYYDHMNYVLLRIAFNETAGGSVLDLLRVENGERTYPLKTWIALEDAPVFLQVIVRGRETCFYWGYTEESMCQIGDAFDTSHFSDEYCKYGEFTGSFLGIACVDSLFHKATADFGMLSYEALPHRNS